ncbi:ATP-binding protein [Pararhodospirillum oryzae]|uniref:histidine kinase n=1 Tax=Pararhodospirillum oryzae TaxID=478448 RepID=A0A512H5X5_9PROT|nr:ATP-binding protein [Pararhodospirillum oryzae]GEO80842.1 histidine kinase [Pararhodospirillum oryzae]
MDRQTPGLGRLMSVVMMICVPTTATVLGLAALGMLPIGAAVLSVLLVWMLTALLVRFAFRDLLAATRYLRDLGTHASEESPPPPELRLDVAQSVVSAGRVLDRLWRRREQHLRDQVSSSERVLDTLPDPLLMLDGEAIITRANRAARTLFARSMTGQEITTVLRDPGVLDAVEAVLEKIPTRQVGWVMPGSVEREFEVRATRLPARGIDGSLVMVTLHDITALRRLEQMRADFVANASHELRTPLASLIGFTETLATSAQDDSEARERFLSIMLEQGRRMQRLIEDLLSLSRIEMEEHSPPADPVNLIGVIETVGRLLEIRAREKSMEIRVETTSTPVPEVIGDTDQLAQILQNLVDNALKYGRPATPVVIRLGVVERGPAAMPSAVRAPCLKVSVIDRGEGIAKEHLPRLTERFYRVDKARSRALGGTGLGLAIVKHVVARHRGALTLESEIGRGTTVNVFLPLYVSPGAEGPV